MSTNWIGPLIATAVAAAALPAWIWLLVRIAHGGKGWPGCRGR
jgi:hypothetical protein